MANLLTYHHKKWLGMDYELTDILRKLDKRTTLAILDIVDAKYFNMSKTEDIRELFGKWTIFFKMPWSMAFRIEEEIRYLGSHDLEYVLNNIMGSVVAGRSIYAIIDDIIKKLELPPIEAYTPESKLSGFVKSLVNKGFWELSKEQQIKFLSQNRVNYNYVDTLINEIKNSNLSILSYISSTKGISTSDKLMNNIAYTIVKSAFNGQKVKIFILVMQLLKGLMGPAYSQIVPILAILGAICVQNEFKKKYGILGRIKLFLSQYHLAKVII